MEVAHERVLDWWERGCVGRDAATAERLVAAAAASLPLAAAVAVARDAVPPLEAVFGGLRLRRLAIRGDRGVEEWTPGA